MSQAQAPTASEVRERAIRLLARREHAPAELEFKLGQRGFPAELVREVLQALIEENLLSSERYAESLLRSRIDKGHGPVRVRDQLTGNGIAPFIIEDALAQAQVDWYALAAQVRRKRFGAKQPENFPEKAKQMKFLQRRGFEMDHIQAAFERK